MKEGCCGTYQSSQWHGKSLGSNETHLQGSGKEVSLSSVIAIGFPLPHAFCLPSVHTEGLRDGTAEEKLLSQVFLPSSCLSGHFCTMYMDSAIFSSVVEFIRINPSISLLVSSVITQAEVRRLTG